MLEDVKISYVKRRIRSYSSTGYLLMIFYAILFTISLFYMIYTLFKIDSWNSNSYVFLFPIFLTTIFSILFVTKAFVHARNVKNGKPEEILVVAYTAAHLFLEGASMFRFISVLMMTYSYRMQFVDISMYFSSYAGILARILVIIAYLHIFHLRSGLRDLQQAEHAPMHRSKDYFAPPPS